MSHGRKRWGYDLNPEDLPYKVTSDPLGLMKPVRLSIPKIYPSWRNFCSEARARGMDESSLAARLNPKQSLSKRRARARQYLSGKHPSGDPKYLKNNIPYPDVMEIYTAWVVYDSREESGAVFAKCVCGKTIVGKSSKRYCGDACRKRDARRRNGGRSKPSTPSRTGSRTLESGDRKPAKYAGLTRTKSTDTGDPTGDLENGSYADTSDGENDSSGRKDS